MKQWLKYIPTETNIVKHSYHFIRIYHKILKEFKKHKNTKGVRVFSLLPNKSSFTMDNIQICSTALNDIIS